jgi:hypothetical protein
MGLIPSRTSIFPHLVGVICISHKQILFDVDVPSLDEVYDSDVAFYDRVKKQLDASVASSKQIPLSSLIDDDFFKNESGFYRWDRIRAAYWGRLIDLDRVLDLYRKWRDQKECFAMDGCDVWGDYHLTAWGKAAKRGNDVYRMLLRKQFKVFDRLPSVDFTDIFMGHTPMLFITLTVDVKKFSLNEAWSQVQDYFHSFIASVRQEYGSNVFLKCWESHKSGYPHIHLVLFTKNHMFRVRPMKRKDDGVVVFRTDDDDNDFFHRVWKMGSVVDVEGVTDTQHAFSEIQKYITKSIWSDKCDLTNAMICLFKKRQFSFSSDPQHKKSNIQYFIDTVWGEDALSKDASVATTSDGEPRKNAFVSPTVYNCNKVHPDVVDFRFAGMFAGRDLPLIMGDDKPPPEFFDQDYNVFRVNGMLDQSESDSDSSVDPLLSGSVVLDDADLRFRLGLMPLESVLASKPSLLSCWFGWMDRYVVHDPDVVYCSKCKQLVGYRADVGNGGYCPECLELSMFVKKDKL